MFNKVSYRKPQFPKAISPLTLFFAVFIQASISFAQTDKQATDTLLTRKMIGGPSRIETQLKIDAVEKKSLFEFNLFNPYFNFKKEVNQTTGLAFGFDYSTQYFIASESLGEHQAWSGIARFFGSWALIGADTKNSGHLNFRIEHRHRYTKIAPSSLSFNIGYAGVMGPPFSNEGLRLTNLFWRQRFADGRWTAVAGFLSIQDFFDAYKLVSPLLHFTNLVFSSGSGTITLPNDAMLGIGGGGWITNNIYIMGGLGDNSADPTDPLEGFNRIFNVREYYTGLEVGFISDVTDRMRSAHVHLTFWYSDRKSDIGSSAGRGINFSSSLFLSRVFMIFLRGGYSMDGFSILQKSISAGVSYQETIAQDLFALAFNWGDPNESVWGSGLKKQYTFEFFWRWYFSENMALTPDLQLIINPVLNPNKNKIFVFGIRGRLSL